MRGHCQNCALAQQTLPRFVGERDPPEVTAIDVWNPVVPGQRLVDEGVIGRDQIEHVAVLANDALEEEIRLALERLSEIVVKAGEFVGVGNNPA